MVTKVPKQLLPSETDALAAAIGPREQLHGDPPEHTWPKSRHRVRTPTHHSSIVPP